MLKRLWIALVLSLVLGMTIEYNRGNPPRIGDPIQVSDPSGRRLLLLIIDSLSVPNYKAMPVLKRMAKDGFMAEVEPCLERITYVCVKEILTGRTAFTLFGLFQNFGVGATDPGENLLRDAQAAGKTVAMISAGDLDSFLIDTDTHDQFDHGPSKRESRRLQKRLKDADILLYHYIWHDTQTHHHRVGTKKYKKSVKRTNRMVADILERLPEDMDLIVAGDHGHAKNGRHVQGLDIPTVVVAQSPNLKPVHPDGRIPISALRFLSAAITGIFTDQSDWSPDWSAWLGDPVGPEARALVASGSARGAPGFPLGAAIVCVLCLLVALRAGPMWWAIVIAAAAVGMGWTFEEWIKMVHFPRKWPRIHHVLWRVPLGVWLLGLVATRKLKGAWALTTMVTGALALLLYPVMHHYGVLKNIGNLMAPLLVATTLAAVVRPGWARRLCVLVLGFGAAWAVWKIAYFGVFHLDLRRFKGLLWIEKDPQMAAIGVGLLAAGLHALLDRGRPITRVLLAGVAGVGASGVLPLNTWLYIAPLAAVFVSMFWRGAASPRMLSLGMAWVAPYLYPEQAQFGLYATVAIIAIGLWLARVANHGRVTLWSSAVLLMIGGYLGLAFTFRLSTAGIDYTFAIPWLPGRLHETFWWVIAIATTLKCLMAAPLFAAVLKRLYGAHAITIADAAAGLSLLRYTAIAFFATAWLVAAEEQAGGARLATMFQEAFYWLILGLLLAGFARLGPREAAEGRTP